MNGGRIARSSALRQFLEGLVDVLLEGISGAFQRCSKRASKFALLGVGAFIAATSGAWLFFDPSLEGRVWLTWLLAVGASVVAVALVAFYCDHHKRTAARQRRLQEAFRHAAEKLRRVEQAFASAREGHAHLVADLHQQLAAARKQAQEAQGPEALKQFFREHRDWLVQMNESFVAVVQSALRASDTFAEVVSGGETLYERAESIADALGVALGEVNPSDFASRFPENPAEFFGTEDRVVMRRRYRKLALFHPDKAARFDDIPWIRGLLSDFFKILNARKEAI